MTNTRPYYRRWGYKHQLPTLVLPYRDGKRVINRYINTYPKPIDDPVSTLKETGLLTILKCVDVSFNL